MVMLAFGSTGRGFYHCTVSSSTSAAGQNVQQIDSLFVGDILGKKSDIADGSLRDWQFRKFENLVGDYYVAPKFLDAMSVSTAAQFSSLTTILEPKADAVLHPYLAHHISHILTHRRACSAC